MADKVLKVPFKQGGVLALILNDRMTEEAVLEALVDGRGSIPDQPTILVWTVKGSSKTSKMQAAPRAPKDLIGVVTLMRTMTRVFVGHSASFLWPTVRRDAPRERLMELVKHLGAQRLSSDQRFVFGYHGKQLVLANCDDLVLPEVRKKKSAKPAAVESATLP